MILSDTEILRQIECGSIVIEPFRRECLGSNSYDVHLAPTLKVYDCEQLDARKANPVREVRIPDEGFVLQPGVLYLAAT
ncbi:MAG: dCTP deaminase, partial [Bacteroidia bacterium]|nr:dCTP deaminase [Bacteroidia bacterium]